MYKSVLNEWKDLWSNRIVKKREAEAIARSNYDLLFTEKGTVISATRDYSPPKLYEILEAHERILGTRVCPPHPSVGGWRKFGREVLNNQHRSTNRRLRRRRRSKQLFQKPRNGPKKNAGRGWLHSF